MSDTTKTTEVAEVSAKTRDLADRLKAVATVNAEKGLIDFPKDFVKNELADEAVVQAVQTYQGLLSDLVPALTLAAGELGIDLQKANKELGNVEARLPLIGKDAAELALSRQSTRWDPATAANKTVYGSVSVAVKSSSTKPNGEFKKAKSVIAALALEAHGQD